MASRKRPKVLRDPVIPPERGPIGSAVDWIARQAVRSLDQQAHTRRRLWQAFGGEDTARTVDGDPRTRPQESAPAPAPPLPTEDDFREREKEIRGGQARLGTNEQETQRILALIAFVREHGLEALPDEDRELILRAMYDNYPDSYGN